MSVERALGLPPKNYREFCTEYIYGMRNGVMTQHATLPFIDNFLAEDQRNYFKFTIVRNSWDRMISAFYYLLPHNLENFGSFQGFLEHKYELLGKAKNKEGSHYRPQIDYTHQDGKQVVDQVIRFENLEKEFLGMCKSQGIQVKELPRVNISKLREKKKLEDYTPSTRALVAEMYKDEIEEFGFKFGE